MQPREVPFFYKQKSKQMHLSISKNAPSGIITMTLAILTSPADAKKKSSQKTQTTCTSTSPECCWVVESWKKMGGKTSVSSTSSTACCYYVVSSNGETTIYETTGIEGVWCTSTGIVTEITWFGLGLLGSIPPELSNLKHLTNM
jgi:hypothetical protein